MKFDAKLELIKILKMNNPYFVIWTKYHYLILNHIVKDNKDLLEMYRQFNQLNERPEIIVNVFLYSYLIDKRTKFDDIPKQELQNHLMQANINWYQHSLVKTRNIYFELLLLNTARVFFNFDINNISKEDARRVLIENKYSKYSLNENKLLYNFLG